MQWYTGTEDLCYSVIYFSLFLLLVPFENILHFTYMDMSLLLMNIGLQISTFGWPSWPLSWKGGDLSCCDIHPFLRLSLHEDLWYSHLLPRVGSETGSIHYLFHWLKTDQDLNTQPSTCKANTLTNCNMAAAFNYFYKCSIHSSKDTRKLPVIKKNQ